VNPLVFIIGKELQMFFKLRDRYQSIFLLL